MVYNGVGDDMSYLINITKENSYPHKHKNYEIVIYIKGNTPLCVGDEEIFVSAGQIVIIPPGTIHYSKFGNKAERIYISGEFNQVFNLTSPVAISDNAEKEGLSLAKMIYKNRYENPDYVAALCNAFAHFLLQNMKMDDSISLAIKEIVHEITENFYDCNFDLGAVLQKSGYAEDYIRAQFKKTTQKTPIEFLTSVRIRHACYLIDIYRNSLSLAQIAEKCGFTDYVYFSRRFKQVIGVSPQKYKSQ